MSWDNSKTIREAVLDGIKVLKDNQIDSPDYDSFALLSEVTGITRTEYYIHGDQQILQEQYGRYMDMIERRSHHIPLQHIIGKAYFFGHEFYVNENVLIPRPDTEVLIEQALQVIEADDRVLDMCTGSGCIILTLALESQLQKGIGVDISEDALLVAKKNAKQLQVLNVEMIKSNMFSNVDEELQFDVIVSNPPYIRTDVIQILSEEVRLHDPMLALDGYEDGLYFYDNITSQAIRYLKPDGWLIYEIGYDQAEDVTRIMKESGFLDIQVIKDLNNLDRVVKGRLS